MIYIKTQIKSLIRQINAILVNFNSAFTMLNKIIYHYECKKQNKRIF